MTEISGGGVAMQPQLLQSITAASIDAIVCADEQGRITLWNPAAGTLFGYAAAEVIGQPLTIIVREGDRAAHLAGIRHFLKTGEGPLIGKVTEVQGLRKNGSTFTQEMSLSAEKVEGKWLFTAIMRDISERKQADEALSRKQSQLRSLLEINLKINASLDQMVIRKLLVDSACSLMNASFGTFGSAEDGRMVFREYRNGGQWIPIDYTFEPGFGVPGYVMQTKKSYLANDAEHDTHVVPEIRTALGFHQLIDVPILTHSGELLGCFEIHDPEHGHQFDDNDVALLEGLAAGAAVALENAQLLVDQRQHLEESEKGRQATLFMLEDLNASGTAIKRAKEEWEETFDAVTDPIFLHDSEFRIVRANLSYAEQAGMKIEDVIGKPYWEVFPKGDGPLPGCLKALGKAEEEEEIDTGNGRVFHSYSFAIRNEQGLSGNSIHIMRDITEQKQLAINLEHLNRALTALSTVNRELVHAQNEPDLLQAICRAVVEQHGYHMAWVGYVQADKNKSIKIMAGAGAGQKLLDSIQPSWAENKYSMGSSGRAVRSGNMQLTPDIANDPDYQLWGDQLLKHGCVADIALPLKDDTQVFGLLHVYAGDVDAFTDREIALLQETADDLAFGVRALRISLQRDDILKVNQQQLEQMHGNLQETIAAVAKAVEARDPYTAGHQLRVADLATAIARAMGMDEDQVEGIQMGATIHDIGKIHLPAEILSKPAKLTDIEYGMIKSHSQVGYDILKDITFPWPVADIAHQHHERLDGSGYPQGLKGDDICIEARIVAVADVVEAMASHRPYRPALGIDAALKEIKSQRGKWLDTVAVDACLKLFKENKFTWSTHA